MARRRELKDDPIASVGLALLGALVALALTFGDALGSPWSDDAERFARQTESIVWFGAVVVQFVLWAALQPAMWARANRFKRGEHWLTSLVCFIVVGAVVALVVYVASTVELDYPLPHHDLKLLILTILGILATLPGVLTIWRVQRLAGALKADVGTKGWEQRVGGSKHPVDALRDLRDALDDSLFFLGLILGAAVVSAALFRIAIIAWYPPVAKDAEPVISPFYLVIYGAGFTLLLVAFYGAARSRVVAVSEKAVAALVPIPPGNQTAAELFDDRDTYAKQLKLDTPLGTSLTAGIGILTPLVTGLLGFVDLG